MKEIEKMMGGKIYNPNDPELMEKRIKAHVLCHRFNALEETESAEREAILRELLSEKGENVFLQGPIYFDYGFNTKIGKNSYANFNLTVLDVCPVSIGENAFIGPNVSFLTPKHPLCFSDRNLYFDEELKMMTDKEYGAPITIGDNVWIAGNVTILGGVTIGSGSVIGAGSVVNKDIPENCLAFGNPCKVKREITEKDRLEFHPECF